jgi:uncharacterized phage-associated protein
MCIYSLPHVANDVLRHAYVDRRYADISSMKLQKILYYFYKEYLKRTGKPLFAERFLRGQTGPILQEVAFAFGNSSDEAIGKRYMMDPNGKMRSVGEPEGTDYRDAFNAVWEQLKDYSGEQLSECTHKPGGAWVSYQADSFIADEEIMNEPDPPWPERVIRETLDKPNLRVQFVGKLAQILGVDGYASEKK